MYEYTTTQTTVVWSGGAPMKHSVVTPKDDNWEMCGFAVESIESIDENYSLLWWTWKRKKQTDEIISE